MPTISQGHTPLTLINVFTVSPEKQHELIELLTGVTEQNVRHHKGFVSASLHRGIDGKKVTMYAQWASVEDYESMRRVPVLPLLWRKHSNWRRSIRGCMRLRRFFFPTRNSLKLVRDRKKITGREC